MPLEKTLKLLKHECQLMLSAKMGFILFLFKKQGGDMKGYSLISNEKLLYKP